MKVQKLNKILLIIICFFSFITVKADNDEGKYTIWEVEFNVIGSYKKNDFNYEKKSERLVFQLKYEDGVGYYYNVPDNCDGASFDCKDTERFDIGFYKDNLKTNLVKGPLLSTTFSVGKLPLGAELLYIDLQGMAHDSDEIAICIGEKSECKDENESNSKFVDYGAVSTTGGDGAQYTTFRMDGRESTYRISSQKNAIFNVIKSSLNGDASYKVNTTQKLGDGGLCDTIYMDGNGNVTSDNVDTVINTLDADLHTKFETLKDSAIIANPKTHEKLKAWFDIPEEEENTYLTQFLNRIVADCGVVVENSRADLTTEEQMILDQTQEIVDETVELIITSYFNVNIDIGGFVGDESCEGFLGDPEEGPEGNNPGSPAYYLTFTMNLIKYAGIAATFIFSIIDFLKAITSQDKDLLQKAIKSSSTRLILAVVIFFLPIVIDYILELFGAYGSCVK